MKGINEMNSTEMTENRPLIVELVEAREGDRMLVRIADRTEDEIYGTALDVEPYQIEAPVLEVQAAIALAREILRLVSPGYDDGAPLKSWSEMFPRGRHIYYEGDEPQKFADEIRTEFGFDPSADEYWGLLIPGDDLHDDAFTSYCFRCPPEILDAVYGSGRWPMGS
jgi:hypothetical protein